MLAREHSWYYLARLWPIRAQTARSRAIESAIRSAEARAELFSRFFISFFGLNYFGRFKIGAPSGENSFVIFSFASFCWSALVDPLFADS